MTLNANRTLQRFLTYMRLSGGDLTVCFFCLFEFTEQTCSGDASFPSPQEKITEKYSWVIDSKQQRAEMRASGLEELQMVLHFNRNACKKKI